MEMSPLALLPPLIVVITAFLTKRLNIALTSGIITSAFVVQKTNVKEAFLLLIKRLSAPLFEIDSFYLYSFLLLISILATLFVYTGATRAFAQRMSARLRNKRAMETSSILVSCILAVDDYLSILTTGYVMSPLADKFGVARIKLAYLVHSLAGVVVILAPVSSWVATISGYLATSGIDPHNPMAQIADDPFFVYLTSLPFIFYSLLTILTVIFIVRWKISFGPMAQYEEETSPLSSPAHPDDTASHSISEFLLPLIVLVGVTFIGIPYAGGFWLFGGERSFISALQNNTQTFFVMFVAICAALTTALFLAYRRHTLKTRDLPRIVLDGFNLMKTAIIMVFLASVLSVMLRNDVQTGSYLAYLLQGAFSLSLIPLLFFILSLICAIATGSAWGTIGLMSSIAVPMLTSLLGVVTPAPSESIPLLYPLLGAIFSGAVCGDHVSPFSETTIMTSSACGVNPLAHFYTQIFYAIPVIIGTAISFFIAGILSSLPLLANAAISLLTGVLITFTIILLCNKKR